MTLWKSGHSSTYGPALHKWGPHLELFVVIAITAASSVLLVWLVPPPLVLPALSFVSFVIAGISIRVLLRGRSACRWHNALGRGGRIRVDLGCRRHAE